MSDATDELDQTERFFKALLERVNGVELEHYDTAGRQGAVDFVFPCAGGVAAVEVTFLRNRLATQWEKLLADQPTLDVDSERSWSLVFPHIVKRDEIVAHLGVIVALCDYCGVDSPEALPAGAWTADVEWWTDHHLQLEATRRGSGGLVFLVPEGAGGFLDSETIDEGIDRLLGHPLIGRKVRKLGEHPDAVERHLAVAVDMYELAFPLVTKLTGNIKVLPKRTPSIAPLVTHLWVLGQFSFELLAWNVAHGWHRMSW